MAFGFRMELTTSAGLDLVMRPYLPEEVKDIWGSMSQYDVCKYISLDYVQSVTQVETWLEGVSNDSHSRLWSICVRDGEKETPIGTTNYNITDPTTRPEIAGSGIVIYNPKYWGQGIASATHRARGWYAFRIDGLLAVESGVIHGNIGSLKSLEAVGYMRTGTRYHFTKVDGLWRDHDNLLLVNPARWDEFWASSTNQPEDAERARLRTYSALEWAEGNISLV